MKTWNLEVRWIDSKQADCLDGSGVCDRYVGHACDGAADWTAGSFIDIGAFLLRTRNAKAWSGLMPRRSGRRNDLIKVASQAMPGNCLSGRRRLSRWIRSKAYCSLSLTSAHLAARIKLD